MKHKVSNDIEAAVDAAYKAWIRHPGADTWAALKLATDAAAAQMRPDAVKRTRNVEK